MGELHIEPYQGDTEQMIEKPDLEVNIIITESMPEKLELVPDEAEDDIEKSGDSEKSNCQEELDKIWDRIVLKPP